MAPLRSRVVNEEIVHLGQSEHRVNEEAVGPEWSLPHFQREWEVIQKVGSTKEP